MAALSVAKLLLVAPVALAVRVQQAAEDSQVTGPPLCAPEIVADTCKLLSGGTTEATAQQLQTLLASNHDIAVRAWEEVGLPGGRSAPCSDICSLTSNLVDDLYSLPPSSDVGCYKDGDTIKCDLDLSPAALSHLVPPGTDLPNLHDKVALPQEALYQEAMKQMMKQKKKAPELKERAKTVDYALHDFLVRTLNLFRIYPTPAASFHKKPEDMARAEQALLEAHGEAIFNMTGGCYSWCQPDACTTLPLSCGKCLACKEGRAFTRFTTSMAPATTPSTTTTSAAVHSVVEATAGDCHAICRDISDPCLLQFTCGGCPACRSGLPATIASQTIMKEWTWKPTTSTPATTASQTTMKEWMWKPTTSTPKLGRQEEDWKVEVQKRNMQAQAYVNKAILALKSRTADKQTIKWFGATAHSDIHVQLEMTRVLNSVAAMMGNVEYVFPGPDCEENTYAYVYPRGRLAKDGSGKFVFYLCQLYMDSEVSVQIETLTHEGSHHATSYTDDVCMDEYYGGKAKPTYIEEPTSAFLSGVNVDDSFDWKISSFKSVPAVVRMIKGDKVVLQLEPEEDCENTAYGRSSCAELAQKDPVKALRNADNVCYWIQDVVDQS